jgi:hypothetical protein
MKIWLYILPRLPAASRISTTPFHTCSALKNQTPAAATQPRAKAPKSELRVSRRIAANIAKLPGFLSTRGGAMMARTLRLALMVLMAIASAVFIYGMLGEFNRLPPQSATTNQGNPQPH